MTDHNHPVPLDPELHAVLVDAYRAADYGDPSDPAKRLANTTGESAVTIALLGRIAADLNAVRTKLDGFDSVGRDALAAVEPVIEKLARSRLLGMFGG